MNISIEKVSAFITQKRNEVESLLVFKHPTAGIQIPAGSVEPGEDIQTTAIRETYEETGLQHAKIEAYLGCMENELDAHQRIITHTTKVYIKPDLNAVPYKEKLTRGLTVDYRATHKNFTHVTYIEYAFDEHFKPKCIDYIIDGWVPTENLSAQKRRHFFHLSTEEKTADTWQLKSDRDYIFMPFWAPLKPKPHLIPPQDKWLDFVYEKLLDKNMGSA
ncbi:NUDIX domain-containing protein [Candidatus Poribacteria bacterium]|nr:NUDIX domain-containing protein [Candidatus Poribacteria bacterium]MYF54987.1 NUDIX domain-containing protein [Candidatus Poribacteria bacterium]MYI94107.1 NUDIX domain-containing protein [Candidatus Poribacteria bacterium]